MRKHQGLGVSGTITRDRMRAGIKVSTWADGFPNGNGTDYAAICARAGVGA
jgi:hypothetical protein